MRPAPPASCRLGRACVVCHFLLPHRRPGYRRFPYTCIFAMLRERPNLSNFVVKSSPNTPVMQRTRRVRIMEQLGWYAHKIFARRLSIRTSHRLGDAPVRLACTQQGPDVALCLRAQGDGAFLRIAPQRYKPTTPLLRGTVVPPPSAKSSWSQKVPT